VNLHLCREVVHAAVGLTRMALEALEMLEAATVLYDTSVEWYALGFLLFEL
jgi:hypothetical protein